MPLISLEYTVLSPDGRFSVSFPGKPEFSTEQVASDEGILDNNMYIYEYSAELVYMLAYTDYATEHVFNYDPDELLNNAMNGFVDEIGMTVQKSDKIKSGNHPGLEFIASGNQYYSHMCDFLVDARLYQIGLLSSGGKVNSDDASAFFSSFIIK